MDLDQDIHVKQLLITRHELLRNNDKGLQRDMVIVNFSKAFDTVAHGKLLHKLEEYGINGINGTINTMCTKRNASCTYCLIQRRAFQTSTIV